MGDEVKSEGGERIGARGGLLGRLALTLASLLVAYGLLEAAVWVVYRPPLIQPVDAQELEIPTETLRAAREQAGLGFRDPSVTLHPYLGFVYLPHEAREEGAPMGIPVSPVGFLDAMPSLRTRGEGRVVIGLTGGSVAGQLGTAYAHHLLEALRSRPELAGRELDMVWLGMPGYHQPQQVITLSWLLAQGGEFDVFVNVDGFNEIAVGPVLNVPQGAHPLFPMNWSMISLDVPDVRVRRCIGAMDALARERRDRAAAFLDAPWSASPLARHLRALDDRRLELRIDEYGRELREIPVEEVPWHVSGPLADHGPLEQLVPAGVDVWERCSLQLKALCDAHDIRYVHVLQPNQYDPDSKPLNGTERESAYDAEGPYRPAVELGYPLLREAGARLADAGVDFHDLSRVFAGVDETLYVDVCCHYNHEGNRLLSQGIAEAVGEALLL